jgi:protein-disulfide isomerase
MTKKSKKWSTVLIIIVCCAAVWGAKTFIWPSKGSLSVAAQSKIKGELNAPLKITEFIDFQCPACAKGSEYLAQTFEAHPHLIRLQLKHFPLSMHTHGQTSALYAECAAQQGLFWPMHDLLIERQGNWKRLDNAQPAFNQMAKEAQLNLQELNACLQGDKAYRMIEKNKAEGRNLGIRSTPTYFVNGNMAVGMQSLQQEVNKYLSANGN